MKKVLLGLLALSAVSMAAPITNATMNADGVNETSVFNQGDKGIVNVEGSMVSKIPVLKYVIYAGNAEGTIMEDELVLPDFIITTIDDISKAGFDKTVPINNIYVKKIIANGATEVDAPTFGEFGTNEKVKFKVKLDPFYTAIPKIGDFIEAEGAPLEFNGLSLLSKTELQSFVDHMKAVMSWTSVVGTGGMPLRDSGSTVTESLYKSVFVESKNNGELSFKSSTPINVKPNSYLIARMLDHFKTKKPFTHVTVEAVVENI